MSLRDDLYQAIIDQPARDRPRRRYADYLEEHGDQLGEYIRVSLERARRGFRSESLPANLDDELAAPIRQWIRTWQVDRGLISLVEMDGKAFVDHGRDVFARAPIQHLNLTNAKSVFAEIVQSPVLARAQTLSIVKENLGDAEAKLLASSAYVRALVYLDLSANKIGQAGLEAITASSNLAALKMLHFDYNLVASPVAQWSSDGVSGLVYRESGGPIQAMLRQKYGEKPWMEPPHNLDRFRMCDAGE